MFYKIALLSHRAKTHDCKSEIVRLACLSQEEMYPSELVNTCPMLKSASFEKDSSHLGCFKDSFNDRILKVRFMNRPAFFVPTYSLSLCSQGKMPSLKATNSRRQCFEACSTWGYPFAGVQVGLLYTSRNLWVLSEIRTSMWSQGTPSICSSTVMSVFVATNFPRLIWGSRILLATTHARDSQKKCVEDTWQSTYSRQTSTKLPINQQMSR